MARDTARTEGSLHIGMRERELYVLLPMLIVLASGTHKLASVIDGGLQNPDSYMRMVRLQDVLRQHELVQIVARDASGAGMTLYWSHLVDFLLCLLAAPLRLVFDTDTALHAAAVIFGPLCIGALGLALAWAVAPVAERRWRWLAPVVAALSAPIVAYGLPGVVHHHVLLVMVAAMTAGYALRGALGPASDGAGLALGAWGGVGIWLSPESMPFILMAFGGLWLAWTLRPRDDLTRMIVRTAISFLVVVAGALAVDPPYAGHASIEIDRLSVVYLALACAILAMALAAAVMTRRFASRRGGGTRIALCLAVPAICLGAWIALFPALLLGTDGLLTSQQAKAFFGGIAEMMPVHGLREVVAFLLPGVLTAGALAWLALSRRSLLLGYAAVCAGVLVELGAVHVRFAAYPAAAAAAMLPILITLCAPSLARWTEAAQAATRVGLMVLFALVPRAQGLLPSLSSPAAAAVSDNAPSCGLSDTTAMLANHAGEIVLADPGDAPELLYRTQVLTVGSLYHRNIDAFMRLRAAWRSRPSDTVPAALRATGATLVLFCPSRSRSMLVADLPPDTLLDRLNQGRVPSWLQKLDEDPRSGNVLYEVMP